MTAANQIVSLGLKDLGYEYVNSEFPNQRTMNRDRALICFQFLCHSRRLLVCQGPP